MKLVNRSSILAPVLVTILGVAAWSAATPQAPVATSSRAYLHSYNLPSSGLALEGYSPVSYFTEGRAVAGKPQHATTFNDVTYYFASADQRKAFDRDPEKYIPAFGGWCAFGMAIQDKFPVDPTNFKIVDGRLLLFLRNQGIDALQLWNQGDDAEQMSKAAAHWQKVSG